MQHTIRACLAGLIAFTIINFDATEAVGQHRYEILVFSKTEGLRRNSIETGTETIKKLGAENNFGVFATENADYFHSDSLEHYQAIVFLNTTLDILDADQEEAMMSYIQAGGGWVGVHAATDTEYDWEWYGGLVGAYSSSHADVQPADIIVTDRRHPSTKDLPLLWNHTDEWYNYNINPRANVHVLAVLKESSYEGGVMGDDHPIAWAHHYDGGRAWYTGLGHTVESYEDPYMRSHLLGGIEWAAAAVEADVTATLASAYNEVLLTSELTDPMEIDITSDGRVFIVEWAGGIKIWEPDTHAMRVIGWLPVDKKIEDGLLGLALDPNFDENSWVYIYYSVISDESDVNRLSRFVYDGHMMDMDSEIPLLEIPVQRVKCCHSAGSIQFDKDGLLYLSTGDNSGGDRNSPDPDLRRMSDQGRTASNTNDLRGKIIRIRPEPDGTYSIPDGNLFQADSLHRGEIYSMGHRNPFRISIDDSTGWIYWGDIGPGLIDSWDEFNQAKKPGFYGWPYFTGYNNPYTHYHLAEQDYIVPDAANPVNESAYNTGARELPPALPAWIRYYYGPSDEYPELGAGGINPMAGPAFRIDHENISDTAFPPYYDGKVMIYEWMRNWVQIITLDQDGAILEIDPFLPGNDYIRPMDIEVGPDGRLYIVEWGDLFWGSNANAQLVRLDYYGSAGPPEPISPESPSTALPLSLEWPPDGGIFDFDSTYSYRVAVHDQARSNETSVHLYSGVDTSPIPLATYSGAQGEFSITQNFPPTPEIHYVDRFALVKTCLDTSCHVIKMQPRLKEAEHVSHVVNSTRVTYSTHPASKHWRSSVLSLMPLENGSQLMYEPVNFHGIDGLTLRFRATGSGTLEFAANNSDSVLTMIDVSPDTGEPVTPYQAISVADVPEDFPGMESLAAGAYDNWREISIPISVNANSITLMLTFTSVEEDATLELDWIRFEGIGLKY